MPPEKSRTQQKNRKETQYKAKGVDKRRETKLKPRESIIESNRVPNKKPRVTKYNKRGPNREPERPSENNRKLKESDGKRKETTEGLS